MPPCSCQSARLRTFWRNIAPSISLMRAVEHLSIYGLVCGWNADQHSPKQGRSNHGSWTRIFKADRILKRAGTCHEAAMAMPDGSQPACSPRCGLASCSIGMGNARRAGNDGGSGFAHRSAGPVSSLGVGASVLALISAERSGPVQNGLDCFFYLILGCIVFIHGNRHGH